MVNRDAGLQPERTALAWSRTALLIAINGALAFRVTASSGQASYAIVGLVLLLAAAGASLYGVWRKHELLTHSIPMTASPLAAGLVAFVTLLACLMATASALIG